MKNSFILYTEDLDVVINELGETFRIGELIIAINNYVKDKTIPQFTDPMLSMAFKFIKNKLDKDIEKWEQTKQARSEAGKKHKGNQYTNKSNGTNGTNVPKEMEQMEQVGTNGTNGTEYVTVTVDVNDNNNIINNNTNTPQKKQNSAIVATKRKSKTSTVYDYFAEKYRLNTGIDYMPDKKDFVLLAELLKKFHPRVIMQKIDWLEASCVHHVFWFAKNINDFTIGKLYSQWNLILPQLTKEQQQEQAEQQQEEELKQKVMANLQKRRQQNGIPVK